MGDCDASTVNMLHSSRQTTDNGLLTIIGLKFQSTNIIGLAWDCWSTGMSPIIKQTYDSPMSKLKSALNPVFVTDPSEENMINMSRPVDWNVVMGTLLPQ